MKRVPFPDTRTPRIGQIDHDILVWVEMYGVSSYRLDRFLHILVSVNSVSAAETLSCGFPGTHLARGTRKRAVALWDKHDVSSGVYEGNARNSLSASS
jgi:hypothetical protein